MSLVHNERIKLTATFLNTTAVAVLAAGLIGPFFAVLYGLSSMSSEQVRFLAVAAPVWLLTA